MEIFEDWTVETKQLTAADFFTLIGQQPGALLHGEGPNCRWLICGQEPLFLMEQPADMGTLFVRHGEVPPIHPDYIGYITYDFGPALDPLLPAPKPPVLPLASFQFMVYRRLYLFDRRYGKLFSAVRTSDAAPRPAPAPPDERPGADFTARKLWDSDPPALYQEKVADIRERIRRGDVYQVNLSRQECWHFEGDPAIFAQRLAHANPAPFSAFIRGDGFTVISSSPEEFIHLNEGRIVSRPIKGTIGRGATRKEDLRLRRDLRGSDKNRAELAMITDLIRNDLSRVCQVPSVVVEGFAELETFANVHHLVSTVAGELRPGTNLVGLLTALFPGGSVTGCPKLASLRVIHELERYPRSIYTGAIGWFSADLEQLDLNLAIRTGWTSTDTLLFGVGGGVVWDSDPMEEYQETVQKGRSIVACLS